MLILLRNRLHGIEARRLLWVVVRFALAARGLSTGAWLWLRWLSNQAVLPQSAWPVANWLVYALIYVVLNALLRCEEVGLVWGRTSFGAVVG